MSLEKSLHPKSLLKLFAASIVSLFIISGFYQYFSKIPLQIPSSYFFLFANTALVLIGLSALKKQGLEINSAERGGLDIEKLVPSPILAMLRKYPYLPGGLLLAGVIILCAISSVLGNADSNPNAISLYLIISVTMVPLVEEVLFRGVLTPLLYKVSSSGWASYFSALVFSALHTIRSPQDILDGNFGIVLGPLLLGLICEALMKLKLGIIAPICFHVAANASILVFSLLDKRWLNWLSVFYI